jgi:hypothetical protein
LIRAAGRSIPFDWRLIVNGYLPGFLYETGAVDTRVPLRDLVDRGSIAVRARAAGGSAEFPSLIRVGVPSPF